MRRLWKGERVNGASLQPVWPAALGGPPVMIGSWAGSRWIERAARREFDGWVGSGARSSWRALQEGIKRFRDLGGRRAVVTNVVVNLDSPASPTGPDDPYNLKCPKETARERLHHLLELGYDDIILVPPRHDAAYLHELRELTQSAR